MLKKLVAIMLVFTMLFSVCAISASALAPAAAGDAKAITASMSISEKIESYFYYIVDRLIQWLLSYMNYYSPKEQWVAKEDYVPVNFYEGTEAFADAAAEGAKWSVGYSSASLLAGQDVLDGKHYVGGSLEIIEPKVATKIIDDQRVRTFAISDGVNGTVVFAVLDAYGLCSGDVLAIRELLKNYAAANNIVSINVSVLHQHSCVDTLGMNGELIRAIVQNSATHTGLADLELHSGRNAQFMENLHNVVALSIKRAVEDMQTGTLTYGTADAADLIRDKRDPQVIDSNLNRLRFVPDAEGENEIWIVSAGIHCVNFGAGTTEISGDYPYYLDKYLRETESVNLVFVQGAQLALTTDTHLTYVEGDDNVQQVTAYAKELGDRLIAIDNDTDVSPLLNIRLSQVYLPVDNQILSLAANVGLFATTVVAVDEDTNEMVSEIGYMEIGDNLAYFLAPGELAPEIAYGGAISAEESYNGQSWDYPSMQEYIAASGRKLLVFGLTNDEAGYILTDNDYRSLLTENEEITTTSGNAGSTIMEGFMAMYDSVRP